MHNFLNLLIVSPIFLNDKLKMRNHNLELRMQNSKSKNRDLKFEI